MWTWLLIGVAVILVIDWFVGIKWNHIDYSWSSKRTGVVLHRPLSTDHVETPAFVIIHHRTSNGKHNTTATFLVSDAVWLLVGGVGITLLRNPYMLVVFRRRWLLWLQLLWAIIQAKRGE